MEKRRGVDVGASDALMAATSPKTVVIGPSAKEAFLCSIKYPVAGQQSAHLSLPLPPTARTMEPSQSSSSVNSGQSSSSAKSADYVYFDRTTAGFSDDAVPRAKAAQLKLEHYYKVAVDSAIERNTRCVSMWDSRAGDVLIVPRGPDVSSSRGSWRQTRPCQMSVSNASCSSLASVSPRSCVCGERSWGWMTSGR